jgi:hypothetical protein
VLEDAIVELRKRAHRARPRRRAKTIAFHLERAGGAVPARSTIRRILVRRGFVTPEPHKRPRSSWQRFEAALPKECWQSEMTHWHLAGDHHVEIVTFLDDHSRAVMASNSRGGNC